MGFNTVVLFLNDHIDQCLGENAHEVMDAIYQRAVGCADDAYYARQELRPPYTPFHIAVPTVHHANETVLLAVGGNYCTKLLHTSGHKHHDIDDQVRLLKAWADKLGYRVSKKKA